VDARGGEEEEGGRGGAVCVISVMSITGNQRKVHRVLAVAAIARG
jgi:hypothetical protein